MYSIVCDTVTLAKRAATTNETKMSSIFSALLSVFLALFESFERYPILFRMILAIHLERFESSCVYRLKYVKQCY